MAYQSVSYTVALSQTTWLRHFVTVNRSYLAWLTGYNNRAVLTALLCSIQTQY